MSNQNKKTIAQQVGAIAARVTTKVDATKNPRSDKLPARERKYGPSHHTYISGANDRGLKSSQFVVVTRSNRTGEIITTRHHTLYEADLAANGRKGHHTLVRRYFDEKAPMPETKPSPDHQEHAEVFDDGGLYNEPQHQAA